MTSSTSFLRTGRTPAAPNPGTARSPRQSVLQRSIAMVGRGGGAVVAALADAGLNIAVQCLLCKDFVRRYRANGAEHRLERLAATTLQASEPHPGITLRERAETARAFAPTQAGMWRPSRH